MAFKVPSNPNYFRILICSKQSQIQYAICFPVEEQQTHLSFRAKGKTLWDCCVLTNDKRSQRGTEQ